MSEISAIKNTPDISFIDGKTVDDVQREMIADFEDYMTRIDGRPVTLGRDINPSKLTAMVIAAGAKRVVVSAPAYTKVAATSVANLSAAASVTYGGLEDD